VFSPPHRSIDFGGFASTLNRELGVYRASVTKKGKKSKKMDRFPLTPPDGHNSIQWPTEKGPNLQIRASQDSVDATEENEA
jgi:hypothetical protein